MAENPPHAAGQGGAEADMGIPITELVQRVEVVSSAPESPDNSPAAEPTLIFAATIEAPQSVQILHEPGAWPLTDLRARQCRFACTADEAPRDQHRFCGRRTFVGPGNLHGSWCDEHLPRVWGQGSVSERNAHHVAKDVRRFG